MSNMSYCRFQNTATDLFDCQEVLRDLMDGGCGEPLSADEERAARRLVKMCYEIVLNVAEFGGVDDLEDNDSDEALADAVAAANAQARKVEEERS